MGYYSMLLDEKAKKRYGITYLGPLLLQYPSHGTHRLSRRIPRSNGETNCRSRKGIRLYGRHRHHWRRHTRNTDERCKRSVRKISRQRPTNKPRKIKLGEGPSRIPIGFLLNRDEIEPQPMMIQWILDMDTPETQRHVREFIGMVNFYKNMWQKRSVILKPLNNLTGEGTKLFGKRRKTKHSKKCSDKWPNRPC